MWLAAVAAAKKKRHKTGSGWSWRLAGIALCAFFVLGVITGLSWSGRALVRHLEVLLEHLPRSSRSELIPVAYHDIFSKREATLSFGRSRATVRVPSEAIALVEHPDGFYQIDSDGTLSGPVSPEDATDLPVISGSRLEYEQPAQLIEYAGQLIRAEATLSVIISELQVEPDGDLRLFLDRPHLVISLGPGQIPLQLARAARVLDVWRGHSELIGMIDMTIPGEAIVRPKGETVRRLEPANASGGVSQPG